MAEYINPEDWPEGYSDIRYIDNLLRCPICFEYLNIAMMLPQCSHNYCSLCIRKYMSVKEKCPTCAIEARDSDLRNNRILDDIIWKFKALRSTLVNILLSGPTNVLTDNNEGRSQNMFIAAPILGTPIPDRRPARKQLIAEMETPTTSGVTQARADSSILSNSQSSPDESKSSPPPAVLPRSRRGNIGARMSCSSPAPKKVNGAQPMTSESDVESEEEQVSKSKTKILPSDRKRKRSVSPLCDAIVHDASSGEEEFVLRSSDRPKRRREQSQSPSRPEAVVEEIPDSTNIQIACPVCGVTVRKQRINIHLDECLQADCKPNINRSPVKRKKLPKLVYSLVSDKDMKKKLREWGLPVQGHRQMLVRRHHEFTLIFNSECDAVAPKSAAEIVKELEKAEKCKSSFIALSQTKFVQLAYLPLVILQNLKLEKNATQVEIEHAQKQYVKTHKSHFSKLIEETKKRMGEGKRSRQSSTDTNQSEERSMDENSSRRKLTDDHSDEKLYGRRSNRDEANTNWDSLTSSSKRLLSKGQKEKEDSDDADDLFGSAKQMDSAPPLPSWGEIMDGTDDKENKNRSDKAVCEDDKDSADENIKDADDTVRKSTIQNKQSSSGVVEDSPDELIIEDDGEKSDSEKEIEKPSISSRRKAKGKRKKRIRPERKSKVEHKLSIGDDSDSESEGEKTEKTASLQKKQPQSKQNSLPLKNSEGTRRSQRDRKVDINYYENRKSNQGAMIDKESKDGSLSEDDTPLHIRETAKRVRSRPKKEESAPEQAIGSRRSSRNRNVKNKVYDEKVAHIISEESASSEDEPRSRNAKNISKTSRTSLRKKGHESKFHKSRVSRKNRGKGDLDADDDNDDSSQSDCSSSGKTSQMPDGSLLLPRSVKLNKSYAMYEDGEEKEQNVEDDDLSDGNKKKESFRKHKKSDTSMPESEKRRQTRSKNKASDSNSDRDSHVNSESEDEKMEEHDALEERSEIIKLEKDSIINDKKENILEKTVDSDTGVGENDDDSHKNSDDESNKNIECLLPTAERKEPENRDADANHSDDSSSAEESTIDQSVENTASTEPETRDEIMMTLSLPSPKPVREVDMFVDDSPVSPRSLSDEIDNLIDKVTTYAKDCETDSKETEDATSEMKEKEAVYVESTY